MPAAPLPPNEAARLAALRECRIMDTPPEAVFDDLAAAGPRGQRGIHRADQPGGRQASVVQKSPRPGDRRNTARHRLLRPRPAPAGQTPGGAGRHPRPALRRQPTGHRRARHPLLRRDAPALARGARPRHLVRARPSGAPPVRGAVGQTPDGGAAGFLSTGPAPPRAGRTPSGVGFRAGFGAAGGHDPVLPVAGGPVPLQRPLGRAHPPGCPKRRRGALRGAGRRK